MGKLASLLNVEQGEGRLVSLLFLHAFLLGAAINLSQTAAYTLFMLEFDAQKLALVYVVNALVIPTLTFLYLRLGERLSFSQLLLVNIGFLLLLNVAFRFSLGLTGAQGIIFALPVMYQLMNAFGSMEFWALAGRLLDVRQGKRLFGLIGAGQYLAIVLTGLLIPLLVSWMGTANLLILSACSMVFVLIVLFTITRSFVSELSTSDASTIVKKESSSAALFKNRYVLLIFSYLAIWYLAYSFLDNLFYDRAAIQYLDETQLAGFLGVFFASMGVVNIISNTFLTGPIVSRYGVRFSLLILPVALLFVTGGMAVTGTIAQAVAILFWLVALAKLLDLALGYSIEISAYNTLYQPLPANQKSQALTLASGIVAPLTTGVAGVILFVLNAIFESAVIPLIYGMLAIIVAWLVLVYLVTGEYPKMLLQALHKRQLDGAELELNDRASVAILQRGMQSPHPGVVIYSLNTLESIEHEALPTFLQNVLLHPAPEVRRDALQRIERLGLKSALPDVEQLISQEEDTTVRGTAVRTLAALGGTETFTLVSAYLQDPEPHIRQGAMVGLLRSGGIEGVLAAGQHLLQMVDSSASAERVMAAQVLGRIGIRNFYQPLIPLLNDSDPQVQGAALLATGQIGHDKLWPLVVEKLNIPRLRRVAAAALIAGGQVVLPLLQADCDRDEQPHQLKAQLVRICGRIGGEKAIIWLKNQIAHPHADIRSQILRALHRGGYTAQGEEVAIVQSQIEAEAAHSTETLAILVDIGDDQDAQLLAEALDQSLKQNRQRIFFLLSFLYDRQAILQARDTLQFARASADKRAYALEMIDVLVVQDLKKIFLPLLADATPSRKLEQLQPFFPQSSRDRSQRLKEICTTHAGRFDVWTRACALYAAGCLSATDLNGTLIAACSAPEALIRETAELALAMQNESQEEKMLSTIEKVLILKRVGIFSETPDETLAEVATLLEETPITAGQTLFEKGDLGDCLYVIVDGEVRVHDGERTLNHLQAGDIFGEMAILSAEPRMASVSAVEDALLLRLAQEPFYELMDDRSEVARGIILVLSRYLRDRVQDLNKLRTLFEAEKNKT